MLREYIEPKVVASLKAIESQGTVRHICNYFDLSKAESALKKFKNTPLSEKINDDVYYLVTEEGFVV